MMPQQTRLSGKLLHLGCVRDDMQLILDIGLSSGMGFVVPPPLLCHGACKHPVLYRRRVVIVPHNQRTFAGSACVRACVCMCMNN